MQRTIGEEAAISKALKEYETIPFFFLDSHSKSNVA